MAKNNLVDSAKKVFTLFYCGVVLFLLVYSNSFPSMPFLDNTEKIALVLMVLYIVCFGTKRIKRTFAFKSFKTIFIFNVFLLLYSFFVLLIFGFGNAENILGSLIYFLIIMPIGFLFFSQTIKTKEQLFLLFFIITGIQCIVIFISLLSPTFATKIDSTFNQNLFYDFAQMRKEGYPGGIACITSTGVLQLSLGLMSCVYFIINRKRKLFFFFSFLFYSFVSVAVARTALAVILSCLMIIIIDSFFKKSYQLLKYLLILTFASLAFLLFLNLTHIVEDLPNVFKRLFELESRGLSDGFFDNYFHSATTIIPPVSFETIVGTGITSGTSGAGVMINADGGFIRTYCAFGLPLAIIFYSILLCVMVGNVFKTHLHADRLMLLLFMLIFFIGEFKEPFYYRRYFLLAFFIFSNLSQSKSHIFVSKNSEELIQTPLIKYFN